MNFAVENKCCPFLFVHTLQVEYSEQSAIYARLVTVVDQAFSVILLPNFGTNFQSMSLLPSRWLLFVAQLYFDDINCYAHFCNRSINNNVNPEA